MTLSLLFWILMLIWLLYGVYANWPAPAETRSFGPLGGNLLLFLLILLLGIASFGWPIKG
jgi:hypothetical protein